MATAETPECIAPMMKYGAKIVECQPLTAYLIPVPLWMFKKVRRNIALMFWTTVLVNVGMWLE